MSPAEIATLEEIEPLRSEPAGDAMELWPEPDAAQCAVAPEVMLAAYRHDGVVVRNRRPSDEIADEIAEELAPLCGVESERLALALAWAADRATRKGDALAASPRPMKGEAG
jgi:hypothetical protein